MAVKTVELPDIGTVYLYKRKGARHIRLSVNSDGKVRVTIPLWLPYKAGIAFASQKQAWLKEHQAHAGDLRPGQRIGKYHTLRFNESIAGQPQVRVTANEITVAMAGHGPETKLVQAAAHRGAQRALKTEAEQLLPQRLRELALKHGFTYKTVGVRHLKSRWGSCNSHKEITLNYYLMQLPWELIDYVLIHELAHTEHLNHSAAFWQAVETALPTYKQRRKLLKEHQPSVLSPKSTRSMQ